MRLRKPCSAARLRGGALQRHHARARLAADRRRAGRLQRTGAPAAARRSRSNRSAVLPGTSLAVSPLPDSYDASPHTQISLLGAPASAIGGVRVQRIADRLALPAACAAYSQGDGASFVPSQPFRAGETVTVRGQRQGRLAQRALRLPASWSPTRTRATTRRRRVSVPQRLRRDAALPLAPGTEAAGARRDRALRRGRLPATCSRRPTPGPGPSGPMIFEESGNLVWFDPLPNGTKRPTCRCSSTAASRC